MVSDRSRSRLHTPGRDSATFTRDERTQNDRSRTRDYRKERKTNPREVKEYADLQHTVFPFDRETVFGQIAYANYRVAREIKKTPLLSGVNMVLIQYILPIFAVILIGGGIGLALVSFHNNQVIQAQVKAFAHDVGDSGETTASTTQHRDANDTQSSGAQNGFVPSTNPLYPVKLQINSVGIVANMTQVGLTKENDIGTPSNIAQASWYTGSNSPAHETGSAIVVAHVGTDRNPGVFAKLSDIKPGALVGLTMGDGKTNAYKVTQSEDVPSGSVNMTKYLTNDGHSKLLYLITCTGDYNARTHTYDNRLIVSAEAI